MVTSRYICTRAFDWLNFKRSETGRALGSKLVVMTGLPSFGLNVMVAGFPRMAGMTAVIVPCSSAVAVEPVFSASVCVGLGSVCVDIGLSTGVVDLVVGDESLFVTG